jgi:hypothetical protein
VKALFSLAISFGLPHHCSVSEALLFLRTQTHGRRTYLLLVENHRVNHQVQQKVLCRLGRLDRLLASGQLDGLLQSLGRFSDKYAVLGAHRNGESLTTQTRILGPPVIFQRLWEECGIQQVLQGLLEDRHFHFSVERAVFLTVLHRLMASGSDRAAEKWKQNYLIEGAESLELQHLGVPTLRRRTTGGKSMTYAL